MEYSDLVKKKANDLVLRFSRHLADVSLFCSDGGNYENTKDSGTFTFNLSDLSEKEKSHVLSLSEETLKFKYLFKVRGSEPNKVDYIKTIGGFNPKVLKTALFLARLFAWIVITIGFILLYKRVFGV